MEEEKKKELQAEYRTESKFKRRIGYTYRQIVPELCKHQPLEWHLKKVANTVATFLSAESSAAISSR